MRKESYVHRCKVFFRFSSKELREKPDNFEFPFARLIDSITVLPQLLRKPKFSIRIPLIFVFAIEKSCSFWKSVKSIRERWPVISFLGFVYSNEKGVKVWIQNSIENSLFDCTVQIIHFCCWTSTSDFKFSPISSVDETSNQTKLCAIFDELNKFDF